MKRTDFIRHLLDDGCLFIREGGKHTVYYNPLTKRFSTVPRHSEINSFLARKIYRDLGIPEIQKR